MIGTMFTPATTVTVGADKPFELKELVRGQDGRFIEQVAPLVREQSVTLDLHSVERIDAAGIAALVSLYRSAKEAGNSFAVCNPRPRVRRVLALVGLDRILLSQSAVQAPCYEHCLERSAA